MKNKQRFIDRIGKRIYRNPTSCKCPDCKKIVKEGIIIHDKSHAEYLYDIENEYGYEGIVLNYRDTKYEQNNITKKVSK